MKYILKISRNRDIVIDKYQNNQCAIFVKNHNGEPFGELSIMDNSVDLNADEVILKTYSENSIICKYLISVKLITPTDRFVLVGSSLCPICRINYNV
ncbi:MAG: hypothetical protein GF383_00225 [Candidatus Lokiarchaeota archaeon]|nr:hypothetical protein [Candidatus Lokiarchaeota archaeon]MBD3337520.1 hypothetical protein [Candidatus Lokiarchaeota archaeon]